MKNCTGCKYAKWNRTASGKLHPSGDGSCLFKYKPPPIPASMFWLGGDPKPSGGYINRREELLEHCVYFERPSK